MYSIRQAKKITKLFERTRINYIEQIAQEYGQFGQIRPHNFF